jgi:hypothetical protein
MQPHIVRKAPSPSTKPVPVRKRTVISLKDVATLLTGDSIETDQGRIFVEKSVIDFYDTPTLLHEIEEQMKAICSEDEKES